MSADEDALRLQQEESTGLTKLQLYLLESLGSRGETYLSITDNGSGLDVIQLKKLESGAAVTSSRQGLGLHIIRDIAEAIHCNNSADSSAGKTTFMLHLLRA